MAVPVVAMPTPVTAVPAPMAVVPSMVPVMSPAHLFRCETTGFLARRHGGMGILVRRRRRVRAEWCQRQRRGLRTPCQGGSTCGKSNGYFQEVAAFHRISPLLCPAEQHGGRVSRVRPERALNWSFSISPSRHSRTSRSDHQRELGFTRARCERPGRRVLTPQIPPPARTSRACG
jgi:hypothetical protein